MSTLEIPGGRFDSSRFSKFFFFFSIKISLWNFSKTNYAIIETSICDILVVQLLLVVDSTQNYGENTKNPLQDFIDFAIKPIENRFFFLHNFS